MKCADASLGWFGKLGMIRFLFDLYLQKYAANGNVTVHKPSKKKQLQQQQQFHWPGDLFNWCNFIGQIITAANSNFGTL